MARTKLSLFKKSRKSKNQNLKKKSKKQTLSTVAQQHEDVFHQRFPVVGFDSIQHKLNQLGCSL